MLYIRFTMTRSSAGDQQSSVPLFSNADLQALVRIDTALRRATRVEQALVDALQATLEVFECDRAWLLYPCDSGADSWHVPVEVTRPEYPGALQGHTHHELDDEVQELCDDLLAVDEPLAHDPESGHELLQAAIQYGVRSQLTIVIRPRIGKPFMFGLHQCSHARVWTRGEVLLFQQIRDRIAETLSSLLYLEQLQRSESQLRVLLDATTDFVCYKDADGRWLVANPATCEAFGLAGGECLKRTDDELASLCTRNAEALRARPAADERAYLLAAPNREREVLLDEHGAQRDYDVLRVPLFDADGERAGMVLMGRDVTEHLEAEREHRQFEAAIQHAQKLESLGVLAGGIAHDFNNLLMGVLGNASLAMSVVTKLSPAWPFLVDIDSAAQRAADLAGQMLAYSGKGRFVIEAFELHELVEEMMHLLQVSISKKAELRVNRCPNLPLMEGDVTQIRQVLMNLIINASDAIGDQAGVISISLGVMHLDDAYQRQAFLGDGLEEGPYVFFEVSDTGQGMAPDVQEKIFDPFFTTKATGRGLGMAAVLGIVRGHKGTIKIHSELGKGSSFKVLFPASGVHTEPSAGAVKGASSAHEVGKILVVDDEEIVRAVARTTLEKSGYEVLLASDGYQALEILEAEAGGVLAVLLDLTMPHLGGREAFGRLRQLQPGIPIILSSGYNEQDVTNELTSKGLAGFIQKPYRPRDLVDKVQQVLGE